MIIDNLQKIMYNILKNIYVVINTIQCLPQFVFITTFLLSFLFQKSIKVKAHFIGQSS